MSSLVQAAQEFLDALSGECFQPGERLDRTRENLKREIDKHYHNSRRDLYTSSSYKPILVSKIESMNPPGNRGIWIERGRFANAFIDDGYRQAIKDVVAMINSDDEVIAPDSPTSEIALEETL
jgi:hypothetical protein